MPKLRNIHKLLDPEIRAKNLRQARYIARGLWWDLTRPAVPDPVFVVGCSRSGTTVTYETIAAAPPLLRATPIFRAGCSMEGLQPAAEA